MLKIQSNGLRTACHKPGILALILIIICAYDGFAQSTGLKGFFEKRKQLKKERIEAGLPFLSPMTGPG